MKKVFSVKKCLLVLLTVVMMFSQVVVSPISATKERPTLSPDSAAMFMGFIYNNSKMTKSEIVNSEMYKLMTGTYSGKDEAKKILAMTTSIRLMTHDKAKEAEDNKEKIRVVVCALLEDAVSKSFNKNGELITNTPDDELNSQVNAVLRDFQEYFDDLYQPLHNDIFTKNVSVSECYQVYNDIKDQSEKVKRWCEYCVAGVHSYCLVNEADRSGRYVYFTAGLNLRNYYSGEVYDGIMEYNRLASKESNLIAGLLNAFTWLNNKDAFSNHFDTIDEWTKFVYDIEKYALKLPVPKYSSPDSETESKPQIETFVSGDFTYAVIPEKEMEAEIYEYSGLAENIVIPETVIREDEGSTEKREYKITGIGQSAFVLSGIKSITISGNIRYINSLAFSHCYDLESINIPDNVECIGYGAFKCCTSLSSVRLPSGLKAISAKLFYECTNLKSISLPASVIAFGTEPFYHTGITNLVLPTGVKRITPRLFSGCTSMKSYTIPSTVTSVDSYAFSECSGLESVIMPETLTSIGNNAFSGCIKLRLTSLPNALETLGDDAFRGCSSITAISIPSKITFLSGGVFSNSGLQSIDIPDTVIRIESNAFGFCLNLKTVSLNCNMNVIHENAFNNTMIENLYIRGESSELNNSLINSVKQTVKKVYISANVNSLPLELFKECYKLEELTLPYASNYYENAKGQGSYSAYSQIGDLFYNAKVNGYNTNEYDYTEKLAEYAIRKITILGGEAIPSYAFYGMTMLEEVVLPDTVTSIGEKAFYLCKHLKNIPINVTNIGSYAFYDCDGLTEVNIAEGCLTINGYAFSGCDNLVSVTIPNTVTQIYNDAFAECTKLASIEVPSSVKEIGYEAFLNCSSLKTAVINKGVELYNSEIFKGCTSLEELTLPYASNYYKYAEGEGSFYTTSQIGDLFYNATYNGRYVSDYDYTEALSEYAIRKITILGGEAIPSYAFYGMTMLEEVVLPDTVTSIGSYAFYNCDYLKSLPENVKNIGSYAFYDCDGLTEVNIAEGCLYINSYAFSGCDNLVSVTIPNTVTSIKYNAFAGCTKLASIEIPSSVKEIGDEAFLNCSSLKTAVINKGVESYNSEIFKGCTALEELTLPYAATNKTYAEGEGSHSAYSQIGDLFYNATYNRRYVSDYDYTEALSEYAIRKITILGGEAIPSYAFYGMTMLEEVVLPDTVTSIGSYAFYNCDYLKSLPENVKNIGSYAFYDCDGLTEVNIAEGCLYINSYVFYSCDNLVSVTIPNTVTQIYNDAFAKCGKLASIEVPSSVKEIGDEAFLNCSSLKTAVINKGVESYNSEIFKGCTALEELTLPYAATNKTYAEGEGSHSAYSQIGDLFYNATYNRRYVSDYDYTEALSEYAIRKITILGGEAIPSYAFYGMTMLEEVVLPDTVTSIGEKAFYNCNSDILIYNKTSNINNSSFHSEYSGAIHGYPNSTAQQYAAEHNYKFVPFYEPVEVKLNEYKATLEIGEKYQIKVNVENVTYSSADSKIASVNEKGLVTAVSAGETEITVCSEDGSSAIFKAVIKEAKPVYVFTILNQPENVNVTAGQTAEFSINVKGEVVKYTWYYKLPSSKTYKKYSDNMTNVFEMSTSKSKNGTKIYCVVTDSTGKTLKSDTVTLTVS